MASVRETLSSTHDAPAMLAGIIGKPITLLLPADRPDEERLILERIELGERVQCYESQRQRKDGSLVDVSLTISPIRAPNGRVIGASKIARDISTRIAADKRVRRLTAFYSCARTAATPCRATTSASRCRRTISPRCCAPANACRSTSTTTQSSPAGTRCRSQLKFPRKRIRTIYTAIFPDQDRAFAEIPDSRAAQSSP
jgi:hypothetical protein